jgi:MFS-type transporter involved in bile tolerance (Atg22 family)
VPPSRNRTGIVQNSYTGITLNAAQSKEVYVAMLPAVLAKNASARGSQINTQGDTVLKPILPAMREVMLNQQHAAVFEQQRPLLAEFEQRINCQRATIAALQFIIPSPPICWQSWPRNILRRPKEDQNQYCCHSYLRYMVKKRNPFEPQVMGKPPHGDSKCTRARTILPVGCNFIIVYIPTIIQLLLLSKI